MSTMFVRPSIISLFILLFTATIPVPGTALDDPSDLFHFSEEELKLFHEEAICFQKRSRSEAENVIFRKTCTKLLGENNNLCENVKCESIKECEPGFTLVENIAGAGCCPGCVKYLEDGARCQPESVLEQCANGLDCHPSKGICDVPRNQGACLREYYNRNLFKRMKKSFYIPAEVSDKMLKLRYFEKMELPRCRHQTGDYEIKQRSRNKAFCVNSSTGKNIFGLADFTELKDVTCKCSDAMYQKLSRIPADTKNLSFKAKEAALENLDNIGTDHASDIHIKCKATGDYHPMQCINETCLCLNEGTGVPLTTLGEFTTLSMKNNLLIQKQKIVAKDSAKPRSSDDDEETTETPITVDEEKLESREVRWSSVLAFGAFKALPCFDLERAKLVGSNYSRAVYEEDCQHKIQKSMFLQKHFRQKGTVVRGLEMTTCGPDDRFAIKQCLSDSCLCSNPYGLSIGAYAVEMSKAEEMNCLCAMEEYFVEHDRKAFDKLHCDGRGNFSPLQCIGGRTCYCADENGRHISNEFNFECVSNFIRDHSPSYNPETLCSAMRGALDNPREVYPENVQIYYNSSIKWFQRKNELPSLNSEIPC